VRKRDLRQQKEQAQAIITHLGSVEEFEYDLRRVRKVVYICVNLEALVGTPEALRHQPSQHFLGRSAPNIKG